ncbi:MAG TPA: hypothetical protein QGF58_23300 [Myxococcota bacterium]|nr:hypothetical protein [Myxococcota bacterium]
MPLGTLLAALACTASSTGGCGIETTIEDWVPDCAAVLVFFEEETRFELDDILEGYLPADAEDGVYGGQSGNSATLLFDGELATARVSTLTLGDDGETVRVRADFPTGTVDGVVFPLVDRDP